MDRERNALSEEEKEEVVRAERAGRRRQDQGSTVLSLLEQSLSELVKSNAQSDLADGLRRATEADVAAVPVVEDGMVTLTQQHLEVVFAQFDTDTIAAVLEVRFNSILIRF